MSRAIEILGTGPLSTIQDLGRPGHSAVGVPASGALDAEALKLANRLVGNDESCAGIEATFGGLRVRARGGAVVAVTGAVAEVRDDARAQCSHRAIYMPDGASLQIGTPIFGARCYLAVRGGIAGSRIYGSLSTDLLSGLGTPLRAGQTLPVGRQPPRPVPAADAIPFSGQDSNETVIVRVILGPRDRWFTREALSRLTSSAWNVDSRSNRVGLRLVGPTLTRRVHDELPSEGVVKGAVQVPSGGQPIVFLNDHPVTGGYPVIAVALESDLDVLAQCRAGQVVRFSTVGPRAAPNSQQCRALLLSDQVIGGQEP